MGKELWGSMRVGVSERSSADDYLAFDYQIYLCNASDVFQRGLTALLGNDFDRKDWSETKRFAHNLKGNAALYGYDRLGEQARQFEVYLRNQIDFLNLDLAVPEFKKAIHALQNAMKPAFEEPAKIIELFSGPQNPAPGNRAPSVSVLIASSHSGISGVLGDMMETEFDITLVNSAHQILNLLPICTPDIVLIDQSMLEMHGTEIFAKIANGDLPKPPVLALMNSDEPEDILKAFSFGITDCLNLNVEKINLVAHLRKLVSRQETKILIVDDDASVREVLHHKFSAQGVGVDTATNGREALALLESALPDLIILDRMMPVLAGGPVLHTLQSNPTFQNIPVMMLTGLASQNDAHEWMERGATDFMTKPFNPDEVVLRALRSLNLERTA